MCLTIDEPQAKSEFSTAAFESEAGACPETEYRLQGCFQTETKDLITKCYFSPSTAFNPTQISPADTSTNATSAIVQALSRAHSHSISILLSRKNWKNALTPIRPAAAASAHHFFVFPAGDHPVFQETLLHQADFQVHLFQQGLQ